MRLAFRKAAPGASPKALREVEQHLGYALPETYKAFLRERNGGFPEPNFFDPAVGVETFFSAGPTEIGGLEDLESVREQFSFGGSADYVLPEFLLAIASDGSGNLICLSLREHEAGAVYFWDHEIVDDDAAYSSLGIGLTAFLEGLRPESELPPDQQST